MMNVNSLIAWYSILELVGVYPCECVRSRFLEWQLLKISGVSREDIVRNLSKVGLEHFAFGTSPKSTCVHSRSTYKFLRTFGLYIYENFFHKLLDRVITSYECHSDKENCISIWRCWSNSKERIERHFGLIPMFLYQLCWNIEIGYYEQKIFGPFAVTW